MSKQQKLRFRLIYLAVACLSLFGSGILLSVAFPVKKHQSPDYIKTLDYQFFQTGDIIFRGGNSLLSQAVISADAGSPFSHVGLVKIIGDRPFVIHASTGDTFDDGTVKIDSLEAFLAKDNASVVAIYRLQVSEATISKLAAEIATSYAQEKLAFDAEFDLTTPDKLYCTELVWRAYLTAGIDLTDGKFDNLQLPMRQGEYLLPSRLLSSQHLKQVYFFQLER
ncbi:MAG: YiiX/YebB-like N1pC/P60 family cysteine hydrolase [Oscillatoria sp. PMC 1068.18]|nr:YiiX/YebB-like N1pC/P60 family cysteine hydrolase [Oscillatoria sp. PMC 1076.18]MEC4990994.1 YiiX/YebB-like N1pC/P60 family cysteine hydrolase [Oscillatoria sp. PMC 1068.18]